MKLTRNMIIILATVIIIFGIGIIEAVSVQNHEVISLTSDLLNNTSEPSPVDLGTSGETLNSDSNNNDNSSALVPEEEPNQEPEPPEIPVDEESSDSEQ
ncbi:hypothetical protein MBCUT_19670 [Methanobrevibacter cuticularis]|uniref:Uncharacterized protein n=1 Tax=Methanobrevibacter cuticularis TaxID=47311 RepID=A0A166CPD1_9EURY|nr:hypothetical protein [Methanobrevibacter cuticularis]KZX14725.1 hypothetical protein MBCUT_19670 [Methanobrevibacter cuticularis]